MSLIHSWSYESQRALSSPFYLIVCFYIGGHNWQCFISGSTLRNHSWRAPGIIWNAGTEPRSAMSKLRAYPLYYLSGPSSHFNQRLDEPIFPRSYLQWKWHGKKLGLEFKTEEIQNQDLHFYQAALQFCMINYIQNLHSSLWWKPFKFFLVIW